MKYAAFLLLAPAFLASCSWFTNNPRLPQAQREASALDPVGIEYHRQVARERAESGMFQPGMEVSVIKGAAYMFDRNPETHPDSLGRMEKADKVTVIANDGLYTRVALPGGREAYVRETDLSGGETGLYAIPEGDNMSLFAHDPFLGELPAMEGGMTDPNAVGEQVVTKDGRTVTLVRKSSRKDAPPVPGRLEVPAKFNAPASTPAPREPAYEPLPEPAASAASKKS